LTTALSFEQLEVRRLLTVIMPKLFADTNTMYTPVTALPGATISVPTLRDAVIESNYLFNTVNSGVPNVIKLQAGTYALSIPNSVGGGYETASATGDLNINGDLTIQGVGAPGIPLTTIRQLAVDRVFAVNSPGLTVNLNYLAVTGGTAVDDGVAGTLPGTTTAEGGGLLASNDTLALSNVTFLGDRALGGNGTAASTGGRQAGGGAINDSGGTLDLSNVSFLCNSAVGGAGMNGNSASPGGGAGAAAAGGALYASGVAVTFGGASQASTVVFAGNQADGGAGGKGLGTTAANPINAGGAGGTGGFALGGGLYANAGATISEAATSSPAVLNLANFIANKVLGGNGGNGALTGGNGGQATPSGILSGGDGEGGGLYADASTITLQGGSMISNLAQSGAGGNGGAGASTGGGGGDSGHGVGGALFAIAGSTVRLTSVDICVNTAHALAGGNGGAGTGRLTAAASSYFKLPPPPSTRPISWTTGPSAEAAEAGERAAATAAAR
jgi:hypothetical protein